MKKIFYFALLINILFEIANVYFIMPFWGSQEIDNVRFAYFLYQWRWVFRSVLGLLMLIGLWFLFQKSSKTTRWLAITTVILWIGITYATNFQMAADVMFLQPQKLQLKVANESTIDTSKIVIGIVANGVAKAYPIQFLGYHHQVVDEIGGKSVIVTYCTVCRTGRVFEPVVAGRKESFRLVGMNLYNAMLEDQTTQSWWQQATGEAVAGKLKGSFLPEYDSRQMSLGKWLMLYPHSLIMQPDTHFKVKYDSLSNYESGKREGRLTRRDTLSWQDKSWVIGISIGKESKAYDWNELEKMRLIHDSIDSKPIVLILADDKKTFVAFERENQLQMFKFRNDSLFYNQNSYNLDGIASNPALKQLPKIRAYQEYWHSWKTFHANTKRY
jgi:hypothetical protein